MSVHVRFDTPSELAEQIYDTLADVAKDGKLKRGANEVTKAAERGISRLVVMAEDVNPSELLAHIPLICEEKGLDYCYVGSQEFLGQESGLPDGVKTAAVAIIEPGRQADDKFNKLISSLKEIRGESAE